MRVWDFPVDLLCVSHRTAMHKEIHDIFGVLSRGESSPYYKHPEVQRWIGKERALWERHERIVVLLKTHKSPITKPPGLIIEPDLIDSLEDQLKNIEEKSNRQDHRCTCNVNLLADFVDSKLFCDLEKTS